MTWIAIPFAGSAFVISCGKHAAHPRQGTVPAQLVTWLQRFDETPGQP